MNNPIKNHCFELWPGKVSKAHKNNVARNGKSNVLSNITCRITSSSTCNICQKEHLTSNHAEIHNLLKSIPQLDDVFTVKQKIGEGTFSCVYLGTVKLTSLRNPNCNDRNKLVALKHVIPTSIPDRMIIELDCMHKFGAHPNIIGILSCLRQDSHVVMVMPYFQHDRFADYFNKMGISEISFYMRNLLDALSYIHRGGFIHRDIKPSNFLYNRKLKRFALVDFGLAQKLSTANGSSSSASPSVAGPIRNGKPGKDAAKIPCPGVPQINGEHLPMDQKGNQSFVRLVPNSQSAGHHQLTIRSGDVSSLDSKSSNETSSCGCRDQAQVCQICMSKSVQSACRAGTPGFRPPEVLLKHPNQTTAVDVWSAGVIFLCLMSGRYPFFYANDDLTALAEITTLFGTTAIKNAAADLGKLVQCAPYKPSIDLRTVCETLRPEIKEMSKQESTSWSKAFELLPKLLDVNPSTRITASSALQHPLLNEKPY